LLLVAASPLSCFAAKAPTSAGEGGLVRTFAVFGGDLRQTWTNGGQAAQTWARMLGVGLRESKKSGKK
jgi:hypothetical protein